MIETREALRRQTRPALLILWAALAGLSLCAETSGEPPAPRLEGAP